MRKNFFLLLSIISILGWVNVTSAARHEKDKDYSEMCAPESGAICYPDDAPCSYCLGPSNSAVNPAVRPLTCNGDIVITVAGFYWNAHQDGMEYAIDNQIKNPGEEPILQDIQELNNLVDAQYENPHFKWDFGFKIGLGYNSTCDGWDIGVLWTWYRGKASSHIEADSDDNHTFVTLWSAFAPPSGSVTYATDISTYWKLQLNLVDIELGREFWVSRYLTFRPHMGLRIAFLKQDYHIENKGGSWDSISLLNNEVDLDNDFKGVGIRGGFDTIWNFGRGWALYGNFAAAIIYGKFHVEHDEDNRLAVAPHTKTDILDTKDSFRASRGIVDFAIGIQWSTMFCQCRYALTAMLGWEHHLFFDQNQMWRVVRIGDADSLLPNNLGENVFHQRRGDLSTQGWTLTLRFEF